MNFDPPQSWTAAGVWLAALSFFGLLVRQVVPWKKLAVDADARLRDDLLSRVEKLERTLDRERQRHEAERAVDRHRLNGITTCFDALLLLIEMSPDRAVEHVAKIKEMRAKQMRDEAEEKAIIRAAEILAADGGNEP